MSALLEGWDLLQAARAGEGARWTKIAPATGAAVGEIAGHTSRDYERTLADADAAFLRWRETPAPQRGELVRRVGTALREHRDALGALVTLETGKILSEGIGEIQEMIDIADFAVGQSRMLYGRAMHSERAGHRMGEQWLPLGNVGVVTAFNFPAAVWAWNALLAAVCGDVTLWKPSPKAPFTALAIQRLCREICAEMGAPQVFHLLLDDDASLARRLVDDRRVPLVSFTGSTEVGRQVAQGVAARLGRSLLELGGNNAIVVDESADLALAVPAIVFGAVGTAGQRCTSTRRLLVHRSIAARLYPALVSAYRQLRIGDPMDPATHVGPLIDGPAVQRFEAALAEARASGGEILCGGARRPGAGFFVEPAIVKARNDWPVVQRETFAPILYVMEFDSLDEAIRQHNAVAHGLSSAIFTERLSVAERFLSATGSDCGIANVNLGTSGAEIGGAFGGEKDTGGGRESGSDAWKAYMRRQTHTVNWSGAFTLAQGIRFDV